MVEKKSLRVLVYDAYDSLRFVFAQALGDRYRNILVHQAGNVGEAEKILRASTDEPFHVVMIDPQHSRTGKAGSALVRKIIALHPNASIILTGAAERDIASHPNVRVQLEKPIHIDDIYALVKQHGFDRHKIEPQER